MTSASVQNRKDVKYTNEKLFVWVHGEKGPAPQIWNKDLEEAYGGKRNKPLFRVSIGDSDATLEELVAKYPAPVVQES